MKSKVGLKTLLVLSIFLLGVLAPIFLLKVNALPDLVSDNFNDNSLDAQWTAIQVNGGTVAEQNQRIEITCPEMAGIVSTDPTDLTDLDIFISITSNNAEEMALAVCLTKVTTTNYAFEANWYRIMKYGGTWYFQKNVAGGGSETIDSGTSSGSTGSLLLHLTDTEITAYEEGTLLATDTYELSTMVVYVYIVGRHTSSASIYLDNFGIGDDLVIPPEPPTMNMIFSDDFNDGIDVGDWDLITNLYGVTEYEITFDDAYVRMNISDGDDVGILGYSSVIYYDLSNETDIQIDKQFLSPLSGQYAYFGCGGGSPWDPWSVFFELATEYKGGMSIIYTNGVGARNSIYSFGGHPNFQQLRMHVNGSTVDFYENNDLLLTYDFSTVGFYPFEENYIMFGVEVINPLAHLVYFDNFVMYQGNDIKEVAITPSQTEFADIKPFSYGISSPVNYNLYYPVNMNVSFITYPYSGFQVDRYTFENSTTQEIKNMAYPLTGETQLYNLTDDVEVSIQITLRAGYNILNITAHGLGVNVNPDYGVYGYLDDSVIPITSWLYKINPPNEYPIFDGWTVTNSSGDFEYSTQNINIILDTNTTIEAYAHLTNKAGTWFFRSADMMSDTPPIPYLMATDTFDTIMLALLQNMNYTNAINYIALRPGWSWQDGAPNLFFNDPFLPNGDYNPEYDPMQNVCPSLDYLSNAIVSIHDAGLGVFLCIKGAWGDPLSPPESEWENIDFVRAWVANYTVNVLYPIAEFAESEGVEVLGVTLEVGGVPNPSNEGGYPFYTGCNDLMSTALVGVRERFSGLVTAQLHTGYTQADLNVVKQATWLYGLDFLISDNWWQLDTNSTTPSSLAVAQAYFNSYSGSNMMAFYQQLSDYFNKKIAVNQGYSNTYDVFRAPWGGLVDAKDDMAQYNAWRGTVWAYQGQRWCAGIDLERFCEGYNVTSPYTSYTALYGYPLSYQSQSWRLNNFTQEMIFRELDLINSYSPFSAPPPPMVMTSIRYLTINNGSNGSTLPVAGVYVYFTSVTVNITAIPDEGYSFSYWLIGYAKRNPNPISFLVDGNKTITPVFKEIRAASVMPFIMSMVPVLLLIGGIGIFVVVIKHRRKTEDE